MSYIWNNYRYLILRRFTQISILVLYFGANAWGWTVLMGNLSASSLLGIIPLSDPYAVLQMFAAGAVLSVDVLIGAGIITVFYFLVGGRAFCSWVCPINIITDASAYVRRIFQLDSTQKRQPSTRSMRYWVLVTSLIISFFMGITAFEFVSPISMVHRGLVFGLGFGWAAMLIIFLFDLFVLKNGWCGHICPLGGFYSIIGRFSLIKVQHTAENCTGCMECKVICPEKQVLFMIDKESLPVLSGECTNCAQCIDICNHDALNFSIRNFNNNKNVGENNENNG